MLGLLAPSWLLASTLSSGRIGELSDHAAELAHAQRAHGVELAKAIWGLAELGYMEVESSAQLQSYLSSQDFQLETGVADIPTAFVATYRSLGATDRDPTIAILAEFDALPGLNQAATPARNITQANAPGHACGHHLFGAASATASVATCARSKSLPRSAKANAHCWLPSIIEGTQAACCAGVPALCKRLPHVTTVCR